MLEKFFDESFDSILVRLKERGSLRSLRLLFEFRFHTGSIKRYRLRDKFFRSFVSIPYWFD